MAQAACVFLGEAHEFGRGVPQDIERARQLYTTACEQPRGAGCLELARLRFRQREPHADILPTALRGCDVHHEVESCLLAACLALRPTFDPEVERLFDKACDAHHSPISTSCTIVDEVARCSNYFAMVRQGAP